LAVLVASVLAIRFRHRPAQSPDAKNKAGIEQLTNTPPLTLSHANGLLARAPSFKATLDDVAFHRQRSRLSKGTRSALGTLSKEGVKL
jgi:hypothetical protein